MNHFDLILSQNEKLQNKARLFMNGCSSGSCPTTCFDHGRWPHRVPAWRPLSPCSSAPGLRTRNLGGPAGSPLPLSPDARRATQDLPQTFPLSRSHLGPYHTRRLGLPWESIRDSLPLLPRAPLTEPHLWGRPSTVLQTPANSTWM